MPLRNPIRIFVALFLQCESDGYPIKQASTRCEPNPCALLFAPTNPNIWRPPSKRIHIHTLTYLTIHISTTRCMHHMRSPPPIKPSTHLNNIIPRTQSSTYALAHQPNHPPTNPPDAHHTQNTCNCPPTQSHTQPLNHSPTLTVTLTLTHLAHYLKTLSPTN